MARQHSTGEWKQFSSTEAIRPVESNISLVLFIAIALEAPHIEFREGDDAMQSTREPTAEASESARSALRSLESLTLAERVVSYVSVRSQAGDEVSVTLPTEAFMALLDVLGQIANGSSVSIVPMHAELTTQQAADFLSVSRPFLVELLEGHEIPFRKVGTHRRVRMSDLLVYKERDDTHRRAIADELAAEAQKLGLGY